MITPAELTFAASSDAFLASMVARSAAACAIAAA